MNNKIVAGIVTMAGVAGLGIALSGAPALAQAEFGSPELIAAARAEGKLVYYTANFAEVEQQVIKAFNKRFPEIKIEMVRAPGGPLITRVKTEAAAGKLIGDVVDHSDRSLMQPLADMFQDYAPPNAADYNPDAQISPNLWPRATLVWSIAYNTELVKDPPKSWLDLTKPEYDKMPGQVFAQPGEGVPQLVSLPRGAGLHDQGAGQSHLAQGAVLPGGFRPEDRKGMATE